MPDQRTRGVRRAPRRNGAGAEEVTNLASGAKRSTSDLPGSDPTENVGATSAAIDDVAGARAPQTVRGELGSIARDAAIEVLGPVVRNATTQAAKYAVRKGPQLALKRAGPKLMESVGPAIEEAGGPAALAKGALSSLSSVSGKGDGLLSRVKLGRGDRQANGDGPGSAGVDRGRRLPVEESVDIGAPLEAVYNRFTQFEEFTRFMFGAEDVEQTDDTHLAWTEAIWGIRRKLEVEITDHEPNARIAWKSEAGTESTGVVTFHRLDERLTRVLVTHDFQPHGLLEKSAARRRMSPRALRSDLMRFKAFIELGADETDAGSGRVADGELVDTAENEPTRKTKATKPARARNATKAARTTPEKAQPARTRRRAPEPEPEDEYEDEEVYEEVDEPDAFEEEQDEAPEDDEPEAFEEEEDEQEDDEEEEEPVRRRPIRRRAPVRQRRGR
jgi:uncharacterized membrane protein